MQFFAECVFFAKSMKYTREQQMFSECLNVQLCGAGFSWYTYFSSVYFPSQEKSLFLVFLSQADEPHSVDSNVEFNIQYQTLTDVQVKSKTTLFFVSTAPFIAIRNCK